MNKPAEIETVEWDLDRNGKPALCHVQDGTDRLFTINGVSGDYRINVDSYRVGSFDSKTYATVRRNGVAIRETAKLTLRSAVLKEFAKVMVAEFAATVERLAVVRPDHVRLTSHRQNAREHQWALEEHLSDPSRPYDLSATVCAVASLAKACRVAERIARLEAQDAAAELPATRPDTGLGFRVMTFDENDSEPQDLGILDVGAVAEVISEAVGDPDGSDFRDAMRQGEERPTPGAYATVVDSPERTIKWRERATFEQIQYTDGSGDLCHATYAPQDGLSITGNGSLQAPLKAVVADGYRLIKTQNLPRSGDQTEPGRVYLPPTWAGMLRLYQTLIDAGDSEGKAIAWKELSRMAELADLYIETQTRLPD